MNYKNNPVVYLTLKMWEFSKGNRRNVAIYFAMFVVANIISLTQIPVIGYGLNSIQKYGITHENLLPLLLVLASFLIISSAFWAFHGPARVIESNNAFLVRRQYKQYLLDGVMSLPLEWHTDHHSGDTIDRIEKGSTALYAFSSLTFRVIEVVIRLVVSYVALAYFDIHAGYIVAIMIVSTGMLVVRYDKILISQYDQLNRSENKISEKVFDTISNIMTVVILRIEKVVSRVISQKMSAPYALYAKNNVLNEAKWCLVNISGSIMTILVLGSYASVQLGAGKSILIGTVYILYGYIQQITNIFFNFAQMYSDIVRRKTAVLNAEELADEFTASDKNTQRKLSSRWRELTIKNLFFSYHSDEGSELHLDDVSLTMKRGEHIALIGASGSGKTTLLKIIRELYRPKSVEVSLDGKTLSRGFEDISESISLIPQDPEIFTTTIRENITMGITDDDARISGIVTMACFQDVVDRLPKGLESSITEKGVNLSGGERQRLALARGLLASEDKSIVLFDEPTSSVDLKNELEIYQNIFREFRGKTIVSSVHRLHLLPLFDTIYFFKNGKVIASGSFDVLMKSSAPFQKLWQRFEKIQRIKKKTF